MKTILIVVFISLLIAPPGVRGADHGIHFPTIPGWTQSADSASYTPDNLWDFIDGAAELFLSYGFTDLHVAEYVNPAGTDVRVELYRHRSAADAFGMYSQERNPGNHFCDIGTQGYREAGILNFLSGEFYVKLSTHGTGPEAQNALESIAKAVAAHLESRSGWPPVLNAFPPAGKVVNGESYVAENFLGYQDLRCAYIAEYDGGFRLFIIDGGTSEKSTEVLKSYLGTIGAPHPKDMTVAFGVPDPHNGKVYLSLAGRYVCGTVGSIRGDLARRYLQELQKRVQEPSENH